MQLYEALALHVVTWRDEGYRHEDYPAIAEILEWASNPDVPNFRLRKPQLRALETYWHLRLREDTPHIFDLYQSLFPKKKDLLDALGIPDEAFSRADYDMEALMQAIREDPEFVREFRLEALRETLVLEYPSYILALAMGAGKTLLIGAIFATEFAMAQEYPNNGFVENALVFAPGKTIIESLRELAEMKYEAVLPPRMYKSFAATLKLTFTRDGDPDIPVTRGSSWNVIVTNTEKIRIQKETIGRGYLGPLFNREKEDEAKAEVANLRLQAIASLPKLAIFSDEAHHTYGQAMDRDLKKVRRTVDYLHNPHFQPQVSDWRSMVDSVMIDTDYNGDVFNITLADVPERKSNLVEGKYMVETKKGSVIAVKVTDMLGEEVLVLSTAAGPAGKGSGRHGKPD